MHARKFTGATSREVLSRVREALGDDALILSNTATSDGMEVLAVSFSELEVNAATPRAGAAPASSARPARVPASRQAPETKPFTPPRLQTAQAAMPKITPRVTPTPKPAPERSVTPEPKLMTSVAPEPKLITNVAPEPKLTPEPKPAFMQGILDEIHAVRAMLQCELATLSFADQQRRDPCGAAVLRHLLALGFTPQLARALLKKVTARDSEARMLRAVREVLERALPQAPADQMIEHGGVYALMGPTGVGKTTTVAKLAARAVVRHGAKRVALLTTDGYRIAGFDQLRIYARILGVTVQSIKEEGELRRTLDEFKDKHLVLIDTAGLGQRDQMLQEQFSLLAGGRAKRLLILNATCSSATLDDVVTAWRRVGVDGCIVSKTDEAVNLAVALDAVMRHRLPLHYVTNGQRVPEDLHLPNLPYLVHRAFRIASAGAAAQPSMEDLPLLMSGGAYA